MLYGDVQLCMLWNFDTGESSDERGRRNQIKYIYYLTTLHYSVASDELDFDLAFLVRPTRHPVSSSRSGLAGLGTVQAHDAETGFFSYGRSYLRCSWLNGTESLSAPSRFPIMLD